MSPGATSRSVATLAAARRVAARCSSSSRSTGPGRDAADAHAVGRPGAGELLDQVDLGRLGGAVRGEGRPGLQPEVVGDGDDHAARGEPVVGGAGAEEEALGDRVHRGVPRRLVDRLRLLGHERAAGRVHQGVEAAERRLGRGDEARRAGGPGGVALDEGCRRRSGRASARPAARRPRGECARVETATAAPWPARSSAMARPRRRTPPIDEHSGAGDLHAGSPRCS